MSEEQKELFEEISKKTENIAYLAAHVQNDFDKLIAGGMTRQQLELAICVMEEDFAATIAQLDDLRYRSLSVMRSYLFYVK